MKVLIADDEPAARRKARSFLQQIDGITEILEAADGIEAVALIQKACPDLVLLDIEMPGMNGFEAIAAVGADNMPPLIFVTAYDQYAIDAFRVHAVDYLLKPFDEERFQDALKRAREQMKKLEPQGEMLQQLLKEVQKNKGYLQRVLVNVGQRYFFVPVSEALYLAAADKYVEVHTREKTFLIRATLQGLEQQLDSEHFARIHRSYILNLNHLREMHPRSHGDYTAVLDNGEKLVISRRYRDRVF